MPTSRILARNVPLTRDERSTALIPLKLKQKSAEDVLDITYILDLSYYWNKHTVFELVCLLSRLQ